MPLGIKNPAQFATEQFETMARWKHEDAQRGMKNVMEAFHQPMVHHNPFHHGQRRKREHEKD